MYNTMKSLIIGIGAERVNDILLFPLSALEPCTIDLISPGVTPSQSDLQELSLIRSGNATSQMCNDGDGVRTRPRAAWRASGTKGETTHKKKLKGNNRLTRSVANSPCLTSYSEYQVKGRECAICRTIHPSSKPTFSFTMGRV